MSREWENIRKKAMDARKKLEEVEKASSDYSTILDSRLSKVGNEYGRVASIYHNPHQLIEDIDRQFKHVTQLTDTDIAFLFVATAVQVARQYLLTAFPAERMDHKSSSQAVNPTVEKSDRKHRYYCPSLDEIIRNPVPFDANVGSAKYGALKGFGALGHRGATIGHDPIWGLVWGTANIATSTLTNWNMESFHIYSGIYGKKTYAQDIFTARADTSLVLSYTIDKLMNQGIEGKTIVGTSLVKEIVHLKSDLYSKNSLPLPGISAISPVLAGELARRGFDMANAVTVGKQAMYSVLINTLVAITHGLFFDGSTETSRRMYEVRTRKILSYSNILASTSNVIVAACAQNVKLLDIGGLAVTLYRIASDVRFINEIKRDFLKNELYDRIVGTEYDFMEG